MPFIFTFSFTIFFCSLFYTTTSFCTGSAGRLPKQVTSFMGPSSLGSGSVSCLGSAGLEAIKEEEEEEEENLSRGDRVEPWDETYSELDNLEPRLIQEKKGNRFFITIGTET